MPIFLKEWQFDMGIFSGLFHSRDKPQNRTAGSAPTAFSLEEALRANG
jgi:hypothetical protein